MATATRKSLLLAFDFDHTIVDANTDTFILELSKFDLPESVTKLRDESWTYYMGAIFEHVHSKGFKPSQILEHQKKIPLTPGFPELFNRISSKKNEVDCIIVSDSNSIFIDTLLTANKLAHLFSDVYTNPAVFRANGLLTIKMYQEQYECKLPCRVNICKGMILESHLEKMKAKGTTYDKVAYVGDGKNDICPGMKLRSEDMLFARRGYVLEKLINEYSSDLRAKTFLWNSGLDIVRELEL